MSALYHPLQALADLMTMRETLGALAGRKLCISWTRSPQPSSAAVTNSLLLAALRAGMQVSIAHPEGYDLDEEILARARGLAGNDPLRFSTGLTQEEAAEGAHIVYARSWASIRDYGNPTLAASRRARLSGWMVDENLMRRSAQARLMHAMPVRRNVEVSDEVLDGPRSLVYDQAENRLQSQKALLVRLLRG
jgi:N-acetylornithine carbamoyltransferase